jgi:nitroreductase
LISIAPARLAAIPDEAAGQRPAENRWSPKEELGHLIDSAFNNHQRLVRVQLEEQTALPGYNGDAWVKLHRYQERDWKALIELWRAANSQLLQVADAAPESAWGRACAIGGAKPVTLAFVFEDYLKHLVHHLEHIGVKAGQIATSSETSIAYPEKAAPADFPIHEILARRWSPRAFEEGRPVGRSVILTLLEAARWAPSSFNEQPWRYLVFDGSDPKALEQARACLVEGNAWARKAPLFFLSVARDTFTRSGKPNRHAQHDVGLSSENLVLEVVHQGLAAHQMAGFDDERARREFGIPAGFLPLAMIAVGYPYRGSLDALPEKLRTSELGPRVRKGLQEIAFTGRWEAPYA